MGDRAAASANTGFVPREELRLRINCAGLAGKPAPRPPPKSFGADGSYVVVSPATGAVRKVYRTPSDQLPAFGEQEGTGASSSK